MDSDPTCAAAVAARIRALISREDRGDPVAAARRLRVPVRDVIELERALADDSASRLDLLAAVAIRYRADACWLLTGSECSPSANLPVDTRLRLSSLLLEIGTRLVEDYRARRAAAALSDDVPGPLPGSATGAPGGTYPLEHPA